MLSCNFWCLLELLKESLIKFYSPQCLLFFPRFPSALFSAQSVRAMPVARQPVGVWCHCSLCAWVTCKPAADNKVMTRQSRKQPPTDEQYIHTHTLRVVHVIFKWLITLPSSKWGNTVDNWQKTVQALLDEPPLPAEKWTASEVLFTSSSSGSKLFFSYFETVTQLFSLLISLVCFLFCDYFMKPLLCLQNRGKQNVLIFYFYF